jgi:2',3'-cyclic-nucleotide 2'-phosphodiesterase (5'-nucleotidase family)
MKTRTTFAAIFLSMVALLLAGSRILSAAVGSEPLDTEQTYRVVSIDYLAGGGDGQTTFLEGTYPAYGEPEVRSVAEYIQTHSPVQPRVEGRIVQK